MHARIRQYNFFIIPHVIAKVAGDSIFWTVIFFPLGLTVFLCHDGLWEFSIVNKSEV